MTRYLSLGEVLQLHQMLIDLHGGARELRDLGALQAAVAQPRQAFGGAELYPSVEEKAAALGFAIILSHPFVEKR